ncbi:FHA domain-containing protein [bacterium]|nr:FHA domain-containing protein [bacterium]
MSEKETDVTIIHQTPEGGAVPRSRAFDSPEPFLVIMNGDEKGKKIVLLAATTTIGRGSRNHIRLKDPLVSGSHAEILRDGANLTIRDLESTNGTLVEGGRVTTAPLFTGARIQIGGTHLELVIPES